MKKLTALLLSLMLVLILAACGGSGAASSAPVSSGAPDTSAQDELPEETPFEGMEINVAVLTGPTGIGAVGLMSDNDAGTTANHYNFTAAGTNNDAIVAGLSSGEFDIACIATNLAATLYNKTNGGVQICALNTYGVLYVLENGNSVSSVADLAGRTIYATGQGANPEYVLNYILTQNGLTPGEDVTIEWMDSESLVTKMATGEVDLCMLPVPAVTSVMMQNADVRTALNLTQEWDNVAEEGALTMGCVVVRTEFAQEHPEAVAAFLEEYTTSIEHVLSNHQYAAKLCEEYGIVAKAAVAAKAIPDCNLCCVTGEQVRSTIEPYYSVLFEANPASIGGAMPGDDFYFSAP